MDESSVCGFPSVALEQFPLPLRLLLLVAESQRWPLTVICWVAFLLLDKEFQVFSPIVIICLEGTGGAAMSPFSPSIFPISIFS